MSIRFEPGAPAPEGFIPLCAPEIRGKAWKYVQECLDTGWVSSVGAYVDRFEQMVAAYVGTQYAVATVNGTAALHIALLVAGVRPNDEVIVSTLTFIAPVNAIRYVGAYPVLMDAEPRYWQMDVEKLETFCARECEWKNGALWNKTTQRRVRAILPVHILGHPCDMAQLLAIARKFDLKVIEDATESLGAQYRGQPVGQFGDIACFSFNGNKIITTGGGGMLVTNNEVWAKRARYLTTQAKDDPLEYVHHAIGYNYRLTNLQAALGVAQMELLDEFIARKRVLAAAYETALQNVPGITPMAQAEWAASIFWMYTILIDEDVYGMNSRALLKKMETAKIQTRPLWQPAHLSPAHCDAFVYHCDVAERLHRDALSLPCSVGLQETGQTRVCAAILNHRVF